METGLTLTASRWKLAAYLQRTAVHGNVLLVKNIPAGTYLKVSLSQWRVLERFLEARTAPSVLQEIIADRTCPALSEFYELIVKAVRAQILVDPTQPIERNAVANWPLSVRPVFVHLLLWVILLASCGVVLWSPPTVPHSFADVFMGTLVLVVSLYLGSILAASILRGAGGEVYVKRGFILTKDVCMLPPSEQRCVGLGALAMPALAAAAVAWYRPAWGFIPMLGMFVQMRPIISGIIPRMIRVSASHRVSDAEANYIFPPNRTARMRAKSLKKAVSATNTWIQVAYGVIWTLALAYAMGASAEVPPWKLEFWRAQGTNVATGVIGSLVVLAVVYLGSEFYFFARERAIARRETTREWWRRWFGRDRFINDESDRLRAVVRSPVLRLLSPPSQQAVAHAMHPVFFWPWKVLKDFDAPVTKVSLIRSGKVGVFRFTHSGRRELVQVLCENDMVGLHEVADPKHPVFMYRSLTPVVLLELDWVQAQKLILGPLGSIDIANPVQKLPFLARISLCQNWHIQAIQRFAELSRLLDYREGETILNQGFYSESFFIIFEGEARIINSKGRQVGALGAGLFFGEIGLLQNSNATAHVIAGKGGTRCLCIPRQEFLRFVTHNYTVALTLERVSSQRLGRPIFPMVPGSFEQI